MLCNNLADKIMYVQKEQQSSPDTETEKLMRDYCETQCSWDYCENYRIRIIPEVIQQINKSSG